MTLPLLTCSRLDKPCRAVDIMQHCTRIITPSAHADKRLSLSSQSG